jgi:hypothetical protein
MASNPALFIKKYGFPMQQKLALLMTLITTLIITSTLTACSSVPISTMLKLSSFDEQSILTIEPLLIRAKITVNEFIDIDLANTKLGLSLENSQGELQLQFPLAKISLTKNSANDSFLSSSPASQTYLLQLSPDAIVDFKKLQKQLKSSDKNTFGFSIAAKLKKQENLTTIQEQEKLFMTIELKLNKNEDFFTLIDNAELKNGKSDL